MADFMGRKIDMKKLERERFRSARTIKKFRHAEEKKTFQPSRRDVEFALKRWRDQQPQQVNVQDEFPDWMLELAERIEHERHG